MVGLARRADLQLQGSVEPGLRTKDNPRKAGVRGEVRFGLRGAGMWGLSLRFAKFILDDSYGP